MNIFVFLCSFIWMFKCTTSEAKVCYMLLYLHPRRIFLYLKTVAWILYTLKFYNFCILFNFLNTSFYYFDVFLYDSDIFRAILFTQNIFHCFTQ